MSESPIRVLHALRIMDHAGIETWLMHLLRHFDRREIAMDFLVQTAVRGSFDEEILSLGGRIFPCLKPSHPWSYAQNLKRILREAGPYDVLHSHNYFFSGLDLRVAAACGVASRIAHIHPHTDIQAGRPLRGLYRSLMCGWIRRYATQVLAPSKSSLESFQRLSGPLTQPRDVIWNAVETSSRHLPPDRFAMRQQLGLPCDQPLIVYVARFAPHKNHQFLIGLSDELQALGVHAHFAAAGSEGTARPGFQRQCANRSNFSILFDMPDVAPLLRCADLFVFPSTEEGFGTVAIEAAAAGLPVVASDLPAIREACAPSHREFMFPVNDLKSAAGHCRSILTNRFLSAKLSQDGRRWAEQFSIAKIADGLSGIYRAGITSRSKSEAVAAVAR